MAQGIRIRTGYTLPEVLAVVAVLSLLATVGCPRATSGSAEAKVAACKVCRGNIEIQAELWRRHTGNWPMANLTDVAADVNYFPTGMPTCPVDGSGYSIDSSGRIIGHNH